MVSAEYLRAKSELATKEKQKQDEVKRLQQDMEDVQRYEQKSADYAQRYEEEVKKGRAKDDPTEEDVATRKASEEEDVIPYQPTNDGSDISSIKHIDTIMPDVVGMVQRYAREITQLAQGLAAAMEADDWDEVLRCFSTIEEKAAEPQPVVVKLMREMVHSKKDILEGRVRRA